jgi:hypothetical protein
MNNVVKVLFDADISIHPLFRKTDLYSLYQSIPFDALAAIIPPTHYALTGKGCKPWFYI